MLLIKIPSNCRGENVLFNSKQKVIFLIRVKNKPHLINLATYTHSKIIYRYIFNFFSERSTTFKYFQIGWAFWGFHHNHEECKD